MGQQQLLLIVLGIIITGIAVAVVINQFYNSAADNNRDQLISDVTHLSNNAQQYFKKPKELGGGNNKFTGWIMPEYFEDYEYGTITAKIDKKGKKIKINAIGTEIGKKGKLVEVDADISSKDIKIKIKH